MSRERKQAYRSRELSELARQLLYAPPEKRVEAVKHAERLHDEIEQGKNYPMEFVVYRLTDRRVPASENVMLSGEAVAPDLRLLIDTLSRSLALPNDPDDLGMTAKELSEELGVSVRTITRWRDAGLRWRWGIPSLGAKPAVLFPRSAVQAFDTQRPGRVAAASSFTRLQDEEKLRIIERARRIANVSDHPPQVILKHLAKRTSRSVEALRLLVAEHDARDPSRAAFADRSGPLTEKQKRVIDRAYRRGVTVTAICARFRKTRSTIYRAIHEIRARRVCAETITVVHSPIFERDDADEVLMQPIQREGKRRKLDLKVVEDLPDEIKPYYAHTIESDDVMRSLIVRYNFIKYRASKLQKLFASTSPRAADLDRYDELLARAKHARGEILSAALPIVLSVVRRQFLGSEQSTDNEIVRMLYLGNGVLLEEIERFDASVAHSFESVLTNRLLRVLAQPIDERLLVHAYELARQLRDAGFIEHQADRD